MICLRELLWIEETYETVKGLYYFCPWVYEWSDYKFKIEKIFTWMFHVLLAVLYQNFINRFVREGDNQIQFRIRIHLVIEICKRMLCIRFIFFEFFTPILNYLHTYILNYTGMVKRNWHEPIYHTRHLKKKKLWWTN